MFADRAFRLSPAAADKLNLFTNHSGLLIKSTPKIIIGDWRQVESAGI